MATPVVRFETSPSVLVESETTSLVFTFRLSEPPPSGGVRVTVNGSVPQNLTQLNLPTGINITGGQDLLGDFDFSGFDFTITAQTATISIPIFQDRIAEAPLTVTYTLAPGQGYTVDSNASQDSVTFRDDPAPVVNNPPAANDDRASTAENQVLNGNVLSNDSDPNGDTITITALNGNTDSVGKQVTLNSGVLLTLNANGSYVYNPNGRFNYLNDGQTTGDVFTYTISDGKGGTDTANVTITITGITQPPANQNPIAVNDTGSTLENQAFSGNVLLNDSDPDGGSLVVSAVNGAPNIGISINLASGAILILNANGSYDYNPNGQFNYLNNGQTATDSFLYTLSDGRGGAATATVNVTMQGVTDVPPGFDPAQYGASNTDLIPIFGYNLPALIDHYVTAGLAEGRATDAFDETRYLASNPDLIPVFGGNGAAATEHYIRSGYSENRPLTSFDPSQYLASHGDLITAFGYNFTQATNHYISSGYNEGRATDNFNETRYLASYPDLITAFGYNTQAATDHYIQAGFQEGRNPNLFNPDIYIASNTDLVQAIKYNLQAGTDHYILYGVAESRPTNAFNPVSYLNRYDDLQQAFGNDLNAATRHYIESGLAEGRTWI